MSGFAVPGWHIHLPVSGVTDTIDAKAAVDAAAEAFPAWRATTALERAQLLTNWLAAILANKQDLARLISLEMGKPFAEALGEVDYAASYVEWYAGETRRITGDVIAGSGGRKMMTVKEPVGVVAVISPWNFPAAMITRKIAPALGAGCTIVGKPSEETPFTSLALALLASEAGLPDGVLNIVSASRENTPQIADEWFAEGRVRKISFTGSTAVGKHIARESASTVKKLSLELGGNAPFLVFDDANLEDAVKGLFDAKFRNGGQTCVSPNRVYVQRKVYDTFIGMVHERMKTLKVGPATDPEALIGPMVNAKAVHKITRHIADAQAQGARLLLGGKQIGDSNYVEPTLLADITPEMMVTCEETFGPLIAMCAFDSEEEAISRANNTPFGLAAYFYTESPARIWRVAEQLEVGIVGINQGAVSSASAPIGGVKESGFGREGSIHGLEEYMHIKYLCQGFH